MEYEMKTTSKNSGKQRLTVINSKLETYSNSEKNASPFSSNEKIDAVYFVMMLDKKNSINKYACGLVPQNS